MPCARAVFTALRATLEEVLEADIVVQVLDVANRDNKKQRTDVLEVLHNLGLRQIEYQDNYIEVYNKIDLLDCEKLKQLKQGKNIVALSALNGEGCEKLLKRIDDILGSEYKSVEIEVAGSDGKLISWLHKNSEIVSSKLCDDKLRMQLRMRNEDYNKLQKMIAKD